MMKRITWWRVFGAIGALLLGLFLIGVIAAGLPLDASLPRLEGSQTLAGLEAPTTVVRDRAGVPTITGASRRDVARALGFVHAQERFFQMDLQRRRATGELAELFGKQALPWDMRVRIRSLAEVARRSVEMMDEESRAVLEAYADGVNAGLNDLAEPPFEYLLLRTEPVAWLPEDTIEVILSMYLRLTAWDAQRELSLAALADLLPTPLYRFLVTPGTEFDAPMEGGPFETPPIPGPEIIDLRTGVVADPGGAAPDDENRPGSNGWALAGSRTADGGAILASDMHLGLMVPNTWFRARLQWTGPGGSAHDVTGVTLPGTPFIVAGSNGRIAWSFTNGYVDVVDVIPVEPVGLKAYLGPDGPTEFETWTETIPIAGEDAVEVEFERTIWGPVIGEDHRHRPIAVRWTGQFPDAVGTGLSGLEIASSVSEALALAPRAGIPPQNLMVVDASGSIGWTIAGRIPHRVGCGPDDTGPCRWDGWLSTEDYPRVVDPPSGQVWTANARVVGGRALELLGDGGYALGARAAQIRDDLGVLAADANERDMLEIQLDDRAPFLGWWRDLLLECLDDDTVAADGRRNQLREAVRDWSGRAAVDDPGYRMVRAFRIYVRPLVLDPLVAVCEGVESPCGWDYLGQREGPVRALLSERPIHLLDPKFASWHDLLLAAADRVAGEFTANGSSIADHPWGERNTVRIRHPLSPSLPPQLAEFLDMPPVPLPGDDNMPRVQGPSFGASERFAVSPGREVEGYFHMPCGQSAHPRSPYYRAGHEDWVEGNPAPFLPGPERWRLEFRPAPVD